jgi:hypothetical protein
MRTVALILALAVGLAGCQTLEVRSDGCRGHITPEMLKDPLPTISMPEVSTPQRTMYEQYLSDLGDKELNDKDHKALIAAIRRCQTSVKRN